MTCKRNLPGGGKKNASPPKFVMQKKVLGDPQYSDCAQNLDNENDLRKRDDRSIAGYEREKQQEDLIERLLQIWRTTLNAE
jgi:hypothetical protein